MAGTVKTYDAFMPLRNVLPELAVNNAPYHRLSDTKLCRNSTLVNAFGCQAPGLHHASNSTKNRVYMRKLEAIS